MSKRQVWAIEGRRKGRKRESWGIKIAKCSRRSAVDIVKDYRAFNPDHEFRVTKYVPEVKP